MNEETMKTMTAEEFEEFLTRDDWEQESAENTDDGETPVGSEHSGYAWVESTLDGVSITYCVLHTFDHATQELNLYDIEDEWTIKGVKVVDDDGDELSESEVISIIKDSDECDYFTDIDRDQIEKTLAYRFTDEEDINDDEEETFVLGNSDGNNLRFSGELLADVSSSTDRAEGRFYSGSPGEWQKLKVFRTVDGKLVARFEEWTCRESVRMTFGTSQIVSSPQAVVEFFKEQEAANDYWIECVMEELNDALDSDAA